MVGEQHGLGSLQMRVSGHDHIDVSPRLSDERALKLGDLAGQRRQGLPEVETQIRGDLIVPAASRVELAAYGADQFREAPLDCHMNVFVMRRKDKSIRIQFAPDSVKSFDNGGRFTLGQYACAIQRLRMGDAALNVLRV